MSTKTNATEIAEGYAAEYKKLLALTGATDLSIEEKNRQLFEDTITIVSQLIAISHKLLAFKAYFNVCQTMQLKKYYASWYASLVHTKKKLESNPEIIKEFTHWSESDLILAIAEIEKNASRKVRYTTYTSIRHRALQFCANETMFVLACVRLNARISKQGHVYYMEGSAFDFKETKKLRVPCDLQDLQVLQSLVKCLSRKDSDIGSVERYQIDTVGYNNLAKRIDLSLKKDDILIYMTTKNESGAYPRSVDVMEKFNLKKQLDLQFIIKMLKSEGKLTSNNSKIRSENRYSLKTANHKRIEDLAKRSKISPDAALDKIIEGYFKLLDIDRKQRLSQKKHTERLRQIATTERNEHDE